MVGDQTFQSAGITAQLGSPSTSSSNKFGEGVTLDYQAGTDTYTLTSPAGLEVTINPSDIDETHSTANQTVYNHNSGGVFDGVVLFRPQINGVTMSYTVLASWTHIENNTQTINLAVGGVPTLASDVPTTGTATYDAFIGGGGTSDGTAYSLNGHSTGTFSIDFGAGTVDTSLTLAGLLNGDTTSTPVDFGTFTGTGMLDAGGPGFSGTFADTTDSAFSGALFGPQGAEMAYGWYILTPSIDMRGFAIGQKK
ncbi:hypothetical protein LK12_05135 [Novosphingobium malaysiense]|uniref:Transferrin-binding protein B C-lobe/N-lobe beta barrel domain-containing protein n=1 Tax=Novosphingobium malaysiense TaxID=1348853 RepID=A0A0B1ZSX2_9SPHN|nr:hypothetical protein LK12_05135 [Novosphingobium malaysiense]